MDFVLFLHVSKKFCRFAYRFSHILLNRLLKLFGKNTSIRLIKYIYINGVKLTAKPYILCSECVAYDCVLLFMNAI